MQTFGGGSIAHPFWDDSWATPSEETLLDLGELGLLRVERKSNAVAFSLSMKGREQAVSLVGPKASEEGEAVPLPERDSRKVAVMHGRDREARSWIFDWLRRIGLEPLEWSELVELTGKASPYNGEAVEAAFEVAQAVVVLLTPDELGSLHPDLCDDEDGPPGLVGQARLNVVLEAGMAFQSHPRETVLVEIGRTREISDLAGRNAIRLDGSPPKLNDLANRLESAGCSIRRTGADWLDTTGLTGLAALRRKYLPQRTSGGIAVIGVDDSLYWVFRLRGSILEGRSRDEDGWSEWSQIGLLPAEGIALAASSVEPRRAEVFVLLSTGEVVHTWWHQDKGWHVGFGSIGTPFHDKQASWITAGSTEVGHQEVFVGTTGGEVANLWYVRQRWHKSNNPAMTFDDGWSRF